jgi:anti-anti-sigma regulatory factor
MTLTLKVENLDGAYHAKVVGQIDDYAVDSFKPLYEIPSGRVVLDLSGVQSINSVGVRVWINFMSAFRESHEVILQKCPPDIIMQINMIPNFLGGGQIESLLSPYFCSNCNLNFLAEFSTSIPFKELLESIETQNCKQCGESCECEEITSEFISFLNPNK